MPEFGMVKLTFSPEVVDMAPFGSVAGTVKHVDDRGIVLEVSMTMHWQHPFIFVPWHAVAFVEFYDM